MLYGIVNTDYILFVIKNDPKTIEKMASQLKATIEMEYELKNGMYFEEDEWDF